jgi:predicted phosphodiesterase
MTPAQAEVLDLNRQGLNVPAIAKKLEKTNGAVRGLLERARRDPAIQTAMDTFGTDLEPDMLWLKNKEYSLRLKPKKEDPKDFAQQIAEAFQNVPAAPLIQTPAHILEEMMVVYPLFDVHLGLRAHAAISGEEMDLKIGAKRVKEGMAEVMAGAPAAHKAVIINGGDFTHQTDDKNQTRKSGHILDVDGRNIITVVEAIEVIAACIEMALTKHTEVEYYSVPGNHDPQNWETIMIGLRERYRTHNRVHINFTLNEFSVVTHGKVAIFIHHGDKRTPKDLCMFVSAEYPKEWYESDYRILMTGHVHHLKADEFPGIYWMQLPAVTARDHFASGGYKSHSIMFALGFNLLSEKTRNTVKL